MPQLTKILTVHNKTTDKTKKINKQIKIPTFYETKMYDFAILILKIVHWRKNLKIKTVDLFVIKVLQPFAICTIY